jgi:hypothetical protein
MFGLSLAKAVFLSICPKAIAQKAVLWIAVKSQLLRSARNLTPSWQDYFHV